VSDVFLFPGQGSEAPGMGGAATRRAGPVKTLLDRASAAVGADLAAIIARGDPSLARTELGQPALVAVALGLALEDATKPSAVAGHSVGEVAAFCVAGCLSPEEAIDVVVVRARLMAEAAKQTQGGMAAIRVATEAEALAAIAGGPLELAAHNAPEEWIVTGDKAALAALAVRFATVPLPVSGAWHSRAMSEAGVRWRERLREVRWSAPKTRLIANAHGREVAAEDDFVELLAGQLTQPVRWAETLRTLAGASRWHIFGPGRVLRGLCRANLGNAVAVQIHDGEAEPELRA
jgi:[acyl-carrier-protein] S-malonyltransferase